MAEWLIDIGADFNQRDMNGRDAFATAATGGSANVLRYHRVMVRVRVRIMVRVRVKVISGSGLGSDTTWGSANVLRYHRVGYWLVICW